MKCCLRHFVRPETPYDREGVGDCTTCVPDKENSKCAMYYEIHYTTYEVKEKDDD